MGDDSGWVILNSFFSFRMNAFENGDDEIFTKGEIESSLNPAAVRSSMTGQDR